MKNYAYHNIKSKDHTLYTFDSEYICFALFSFSTRIYLIWIGVHFLKMICFILKP